MSARASQMFLDRIVYTMQLILDSRGGARMTRVQGKLADNERAIDVTVTLPTSVFKRPALRAEITVSPAEISIPPIKIDALQSSLRDSFGADLLITVQQQEPPQ